MIVAGVTEGRTFKVAVAVSKHLLSSLEIYMEFR